MAGFSELDPRIVEVLEKRGLHTATRPQIEAMPPILEGKSILICAPTGMGKTEAAVIPAFSRLVKSKPIVVEIPKIRRRKRSEIEEEKKAAKKGNKKQWRQIPDFESEEDENGPVEQRVGIRMLYITPLRALNRDMFGRLFELGEAVDLEIGMRHGDTIQSVRNKQSRKPPQVLITTPETLQILLVAKRMKHYLKSVEIVVIDEIHEFAADERGAQLSIALERLDFWSTRRAQRIGLSATVGDLDEVANYLCGGRKVVKIQVPETTNPLEVQVVVPEVDEEIDHGLAGELMCDPEAATSLRLCHSVMKEHPGTLLFTNTRNTAEVLALRFSLMDEELKVGVHHGSLYRDVRIEQEQLFKDREIDGLICTSSLELGIDIGHVDRVIQYNSPRDPARLIQRVGRAGHHHELVSRGIVVATTVDDILEAAVIARRAMSGEIEREMGRMQPLGVLANQIVAMALHDQLDLDEALRLIRRSWPFRELPSKTFLAVVDSLMSQHLVWREGPEVRRKRRAFNYFFNHVSMIPDRRSYPVRDMSTQRLIGSLDENFVLSLEELHPVFVMQGRCWRLVELGEDEVKVEPVAVLAEAPSWIGEQIPVPFDVAQEVGRLRRTGDFSSYPLDPNGVEVASKALANQKKAGSLPTDRLLTIEPVHKGIVLNVCGGSRLNETLGQLLSALLTARTGAAVQVETDAYRISLRSTMKISPRIIMDLMNETKPEHIAPMLSIVMRNSQSLRWQLILVARNFGIIDKDADYRRVNITRILDEFQETVVFDEALQRIFHSHMELDRAAVLLQQIQSGTIKVEACGPTPMGQPAKIADRVMLAPPTADREILQAVKRRILRSHPSLICVNCGSRRTVILESLIPRDLEAPISNEEDYLCRKCGGSLLAVVRFGADKAANVIRKPDHRRSHDDDKELKRLVKSANLLKYHKERALMAMCARGVGVAGAARVTEKQHPEETNFFRELLKLEVNYARTRRFWD